MGLAPADLAVVRAADSEQRVVRARAAVRQVQRRLVVRRLVSAVDRQERRVLRAQVALARADLAARAAAVGSAA